MASPIVAHRRGDAGRRRQGRAGQIGARDALVALFVEMYGFPLTIYLLSGWLTRGFPGIDPLGHNVGHLWYTLLGFKGDPHLNPIHVASNVLVVAGFFLLSAAWRVLYRAQHQRALATTGPYAYVRHPQYVAFIVIMFGFLLQWPTLVTLVMFPILVTVYTGSPSARSARFARSSARYGTSTLRTPRDSSRVSAGGAPSAGSGARIA